MYHGKDLAAASISRGVAAVADATAESKRLHAIDTREVLIEYHQECLEVRRNRGLPRSILPLCCSGTCRARWLTSLPNTWIRG